MKHRTLLAAAALALTPAITAVAAAISDWTA
jgi:hypothetical protein